MRMSDIHERQSVRAVTSRGPLQEAWASIFRIVVGLNWLYYASQKWQGVGWMHSLIISTAKANPIPGLHDFLVQVAVPNWFLFGVAQGAGETVAAVLLILGLGTRWAAILGLLLAINLALTVAFAADPGFRFLYYLAVLVNGQVIISGPGPYALSRLSWVPAFLR
jgi:uncharacterized membrane protein YphA (DoxX/SURF4 family)